MSIAVFLRFLLHLVFRAGAFGTDGIADGRMELTLLILFEQLGDCGMLAGSLGQCCKLCLYYESECESLTYESEFSKKIFLRVRVRVQKKNLRVRVRVRKS